ncbi:ABC transporter permease [Pseudonocardia sp. WMMC193]|uniref:ABC transporter permease n=1 Tax=Pseudonocardia sp. WMMC193 TaxID=2911965 RepID=UPI001F1B2500|nr:ABC transporter permease [Pseudonocardia sp. WMMC193]MCF7549610.1 ABC transporter permease [Pseudonocardia sp. WMMC193]
MTEVLAAVPTTPAPAPAPAAPVRPASRWRVWLPALPFALLALLTVVARLVVPFDPETVVAPANLEPGGAHLFGTDATGMDVFSRTVAATQVNLVMAVLVTIMATAIGLALGLVLGMNEAAGGVRGLLGRGMNRFTDLTDAVPPLIVGVVVVGLFGPSIVSLSVALALILMPNQVRLTRAEVLKVRGDAYVDAARMAGLTPWQVMVRHVLPNSARPAIENSSNIFGVSIIVSASLGFLGVGLNPPTPEWGVMISTGMSDVMLGGWWTTLFPALALCVAVASAALLTGVITRLTRSPGH